MKKNIFILLLITIIILITSCDNPLDPKNVNAIAIILGRHANSNAFNEFYFEEGLRRNIRDTVYGGYVGVIINDGNPRVIERFDFFRTEAESERSRDIQVDRDTDLILDYLKDEKVRAEVQENDLLKAIQEAHRLLNVFEDKAKNDEKKKKIKSKQIIILDNGIVTTGDMNFLRHGVNKILFRDNDQLESTISRITDDLSRDRLIPDLKGVEVIFIGLGDVADPQEELTNSIKYGIESLWTAFFKKGNAKNITFRDYPRGTVANSEGFPYVTPIKFEQSFIDPTQPMVIYTDQVSFVSDRADYLNEENAEIILKEYSEVLKNYLNRRPEVKIYVVGSMARASLERDYSTDLSDRRANTVKESLVKFGVPEDRLESFGLGEFYPDREDEFPQGVFTENIARNNRKVVLIPSDMTDQVREVLAVRADLLRRR